MVQITLSTSAERKSVLVETTATLQSIIDSNGIDTTGATIMLKGNVVSNFDLDRTLEQCGIADGESAIMNVTVKAAAASLTVSLDNNVVTVVTDITKETVEKGISDLKARDEQGNEVYVVSAAKDGKASMNSFSFVGNTYIEGKLAATIILPMDESDMAEVQRKFGEDLLAAKKYTTQIANEAAVKETEIAQLFA